MFLCDELVSLRSLRRRPWDGWKRGRKSSRQLSTIPPSPPMGDSEPDRIASRMRCDMNQADLRVTPSVRWSWLLRNALLAAGDQVEGLQPLASGTWLFSKMVPTVTRNWLRQA